MKTIANRRGGLKQAKGVALAITALFIFTSTVSPIAAFAFDDFEDDPTEMRSAEIDFDEDDMDDEESDQSTVDKANDTIAGADAIRAKWAEIEEVGRKMEVIEKEIETIENLQDDLASAKRYLGRDSLHYRLLVRRIASVERSRARMEQIRDGQIANDANLSPEQIADSIESDIKKLDELDLDLEDTDTDIFEHKETIKQLEDALKTHTTSIKDLQAVLAALDEYLTDLFIDLDILEEAYYV